MTSLCVGSGGSSRWHMFASCVRVKRSDSHGRPLVWFLFLLLVLLTEKASCEQTSAPTSSPPPSTTAAQTPVQYVIDVTVDVAGAQDESEVKAWLVNVFQSSLERCVSPGYVTTTGTPNYTLTTATTPGNKSTTAQSTTGSDNTTTASTATATLEANKTTTPDISNTATTTFTNNTTIATTAFTNNTTTAATTLKNNTTTTTTPESSNTTKATTTMPESSNTTTATTTTLESSNTTIATTTTTTPESTTITTATTLESINTTATKLEGSSTATATTTTPATTRLEGSSLTTATTTTLEGSSLTTATTTTPATTRLEGSSLTTATTTTLEGSSLTTATTTTPATTTLEGSSVTTTTKTTTTTTPATTTLKGSSLTTTTTTTPATTTLEGSSVTTTTKTTTTTPATTTTLESSSLTTTTTTTKKSSTTTATTTTPATTTPPQKGSSTTTTTAKKSSTTTDTATTPKGQTNKSQGNSSASNNNKRRKRSVRLGRDVASGVTQSSDTSTGLFQNLGISCAAGVSATRSCSVTLQLQQPVPSCCILRTLCAASAASFNVSAVGSRVHRDLPQNSCPSAPQEETSCSYTGPANSSCGASDAAYVGGQTNSSSCAPVPPTSVCNCSSYCSNTDSYYALQVSLLDPDLTASYVSSLISQTLKQAQNCSPSSTDPCPLLVVGANYKEASVTCGVDVTNRQNCSVILRFNVEVPVCSVAAAATQAFQSRAQISFNGSVTRTAVCGNSSVGGSSWSSQVTWVSVPVRSAPFCAAVKQFTSLVCASGGNVVVLLDEACDQASTTTTQPNTTSSVNTTTTTTSVSVTVTTLNTTTPAANVSTTTATASAESRASALLDQTQDASKLNSSQIDQLLSQLESLLSGPNVSLALGNTSVNIVSNLLNASPAQVARSSNRIIGVVDTVGLKLVLGAAAQTLLSPSVALSVKPADGSKFQETFFSISDPSSVQIRGIPRLGRSATTSSVPQGSITLPSSLTHNLSPQQQQLVTRVQFSFYQKSTVFQDKSLGRRVLNSGILGASVANLSISGLNDNVVITLRNVEPVPVNFVASCVFWDFTLNNGFGGWNPSGCVVQNGTDNTTTVCGCNHLTSFAVLLDPFEKFSPSPLQNTILTYITYIGCGISAIFLSVTLLTYLSFEKLRKDVPSKILIHLCFALLLLNLVFLVDAWLALYTSAVGLCISTACFLHYFLLASFTWMGLEAVHMYNALVKVFNNNMSRYLLKFSLVGWGVPMVVVIIVVAIRTDNYGLMSYGKFTDGRSDDFCWLRSDVAFYVAVVAYFCVIFLFNLSMFVVVLVQLCRIKRQNPHNARHRSTLQDVRSVAGITVLLGLTWGFAFFAWGPVNLAFMYLFAIFNSLQGFFIFVFYCAAKENVRRQWRVYLCCGNMRLAENSDWSRTATQKTMKPVGNLKASQSSQSNSSSSSTSFLVTDSTEQSGSFSSPMDDREITAHEDASEDVILNEINRQNRNHRVS